MNTTTPKPIIIARNVDKHFGSFQALRDVSAAFAEGQVTAIVGPSESGKSTFLRTLNRLEKHDGGQIVIDGIEINDDPKSLNAIRREVGMVFQSFNLFSHLTILRNITLAPMRVRKTARATRHAIWRCTAPSVQAAPWSSIPRPSTNTPPSG